MTARADLSPVTVIGLGPMGRAMAATLTRAGHPVTVWNRTPSRAEDLVAAGATLAPTPLAAVAASEVIILSLTDYQAMYDVLAPTARDVLAGKVVVNLSSDTPEVTRTASAWAAEHGAGFLTGGVMVPAPVVGTPDAYVFYSGPEEVFDAYEPMLRLIGEPNYLGADPGLAQLFYQAHLDVFLTTLSSLLHATALVTSAGVPASTFLPGALTFLTGIPALIGERGAEQTARQLEAGEHPGDLSTTLMMGATADHILRASEQAGIDVELPRAVKSHYDRAIAAGHGTSDWTALYEVIKARD
ncbi:3-hydroxyisobutyrate dehydrogenase [Micromonospora phaseoli]|uniref:3-hydroxyisobutyrate dehydrogenase n=1 Tax=Micromonospora phaseoli TaxID=1144548 RepID=A0A1H6UZX3_9ACTN|nr:NAD(P)-dependent oxidoreductase [Micromonospora phaseoli]PZV99075.1 3-hydroxyisobutyrate dehydrogenase-like beta-hydroxyacid dehydrogenase [Micromonospora phaseoli]GIJ78723.1 6-phosphogluconate dehydrogenase [Micromonospora phaseoli]SEI93562.1 3-hydroxyisobutyrate dehydrogenase [Micromonospora phaseoli]